MQNKIFDVIKKYNMIEAHSNIIVGLSGGADSVCLFHILLEYKKIFDFNILPVHINHGVRGFESDADEKFVVELCEKHNITCKVYRCNINSMSKKLKITEEEAGRKFRYESFRKEYLDGKINKIAVAHTKDDQGETILMRLFRGSGLKGLCGIDIVNDDIIRPMLNSTRLQVEKYCEDNNLEYVNDSSNEKTIYARNKIRLEIIPYLQKNFNENIINTLCRTSEIIREENNYIESVVVEKFIEVLEENNEEIILNLNLLKNNHIVIIKRIIRKAFLELNKNLVDVNYKHVNSIVSLIYGDSGKKINLPYNNVVRVNYDKLIFSKKISKSDEDSDFCYELKENQITYVREGNFYVTISATDVILLENKNNIYTKIFYYDNINCSFCIRNKHEGDKIFLKHINGSKKIKNYFIDEKIDLEQRKKIPLLTMGQEVLLIFYKNNLVNDKYLILNKNKIIVQIWEDLHE